MDTTSQSNALVLRHIVMSVYCITM